jgi:acyl carrier protein
MNPTGEDMTEQTLNGHEDRLRQVIAEVLGVAPHLLTEASSPDSVEPWDSLGHLNVVMALESEFGVSVSAEAALHMRSVGLIRSALREQGVRI